MSDVPEGYKRTEVGVIPGDWEVKKLGDCLLKNPDYGINAPAVPYNEGLPVYLRITDITEDGRYSKKNIASVKNIFSSSFVLEKGDLVFARTGASVGKTYLYNQDDGKLVFAGFLIRVKANPNQLLPEYLKFYTQTSYYWNWIKANSMRTGQPGVNANEYKELLVPLPPTRAEQTAIATALNDVDALITEFEKLIAKKRNIKQGAMQQLLKPKEGWEVKKLGEECELITKGTTPTSVGRDFQSSGINFIKIESLTADGKIIKDKVAFIDTYTNNLLKRSQLKSGDALFSIAGALGRVAIVSDEILPGNTNQALAIIRLRKASEIELKYLYFYLNSNKIQTHILAINVQGAQANLSLENISDLPIEYPLKTEQNHIAQIFSDMDAEIEALEKKLEKYKAVKQGMMQELLTGKTRLV